MNHRLTKNQIALAVAAAIGASLVAATPTTATASDRESDRRESRGNDGWGKPDHDDRDKGRNKGQYVAGEVMAGFTFSLTRS